MLLRRIEIVIVFLLAFLLQGNVAHLLSIMRGGPELLLIMTTAYTFLDDNPVVARDALIAGLIGGTLKDLCYGQIIGISPLLYLIVGLLMFYFRRRLNNESIVILAVVTLLSTGIFVMGQWLLSMLFTQSIVSLYRVLFSLPGAVFWNLVISGILFFIAEKRKKRSRFLY